MKISEERDGRTIADCVTDAAKLRNAKSEI